MLRYIRVVSCRAACLLGVTLAVSVATPSPSSGQSATGTIGGVVLDPSGASIAGCHIDLTGVAQGLERRTVTERDGAFNVPSLPPDTFVLRATCDGFAVSTLTDLVLRVGDRLAVDVRMAPGTVRDAVTVVAEPRTAREAGAVGTVVDRDLLEKLPLNGRSFQSLILQAPGIVPVAASNAEFGQFSVNGQRQSANAFSVDGVSANIGVSIGEASPFGGGGQYPGFNAVGGTTSLVSVDAVQEFGIQTSTFAPEFGRSPGGQVAIVTRSGTNDVTGTLFEFFRHDRLDANDWFANREDRDQAKLRNNQFGGVLGGPVVRNRTFFFANYEGLRLRLPQTGVRAVPTLAERARASGAVADILNAFPQPNGEDFGDGTAEYVGTYSEPSRLDAVSARVDYNAGPGLRIFGRYNQAATDSAQRGSSGSSLSNVTTRNVDTKTATIGATVILGPRVVNDARANYSTVRGAAMTEIDSLGGAAAPSNAILFPTFASPGDSLFRAYFNGFAFGLLAGATGSTRLDQLNLVDTLSIAAGSHLLKAGVDYRRHAPLADYQSYQQVIGFDTVDAAVRGSGSFAFIGAQGAPLEPRFWNLSLFAQDTWRAADRLTVVYGLRWEINPPPSERHGHDIRTATGFDNPATVTLAPPGPLWETGYGNIAPRVGLAYELSQSARFGRVLRGGWGIFYDLTTGSLASGYDSFAYPHAAAHLVSGEVAFPFAPEIAAPPAISEDPPYNYIYGFPRGLELPLVQQWNVSLEQALGASQTVTASYVGAAGRRLYRVSFYGSPNADFDNFHTVTNDDSSDYHALQIQWQRRLSRGVQGLASYTWAHAIDTASTDVSPFAGNLPKEISPVALDRGSSSFDVRHVLTASVSYEIPTASLGHLGGAVLNGWSVDGVFRASSAPPVTVITNNEGFGFDLRPDLVEGEPLYVPDDTAPGGRVFNPTAFAPPEDERHGSLGRNVLRGLAAAQLDLAVRRTWGLSTRVRLQFRGELFNVLNHPNFAPPVGDPNSPFFGRSIQMLNRGLGGLNAVYQLGGPRSIQLGLKLQF